MHSVVDIINPFIHLLPFIQLTQATLSPFVYAEPVTWLLAPGPSWCSGGAGVSVPADLILLSRVSQLRRSRAGSKETLGSALDSWAELMGGFELSVVVWEKRALGLFLSSLLLDTLGTAAAVLATLSGVDFCFLSLIAQSGNGTCKPLTQITTHTSFGRASSD